MAGIGGLFPLIVIVVAVLLGELMYRRNAGAMRVWADVSQALYLTLGALVTALLAFGGGIFTVIAGVLLVIYVAGARTKWSDVSDANLRSRLAP